MLRRACGFLRLRGATGAREVEPPPRAVVERLGIPPLPDPRYELMAFDGTTSFAPVVVLDMVFLNRVFRGRYLLIDQDYGILGRDVVNHAVLLLDGPQQQWTEHVPPRPSAGRSGEDQ